MIKRLILTLAGIIVVVLGSNLTYEKGFLECYEKGRFDGHCEGNARYSSDMWLEHNPDVNDHGLIKTDYPLDDIYFDSGIKWVIVNEQFIGNNENQTNIEVIAPPKEQLTEMPDKLHFMRQFLSIQIFPVGCGIVAEGQICVYADGKLIKVLPYVGHIRITDPDLKRQFRTVSREQVNILIGGELPTLRRDEVGKNITSDIHDY